MPAAELREGLSNCYGTEGYHRLTLDKTLVCTDGVLYLAENGGVFWLMDIIASYQPNCRKDDMLRDFQIWKLKVTDGKGVVTCERDTDDVAITQEIEYTDFPLDEIKLYVELGEAEGRAAMICMLPSER